MARNSASRLVRWRWFQLPGGRRATPPGQVLAPGISAPSGVGEHGCDCGSPSTNPPPVTGYGPAYGPIAVGATVVVDPSGQLVGGDAFEIPAPGRLHALKVGTVTVRFQSSVGPKDVDYSALVADAIAVDPAWCPGGGKAGTSLEAGDLCPFAATSPVRLLCKLRARDQHGRVHAGCRGHRKHHHAA